MKRVIGFLSTVVFFTAALLAVLAGTAPAQTAPLTLDHFYCYVALDQKVQPKTVFLQDQFDVGLNPLIPPVEEKVDALRIVRFCNPVQKTTADGKVTGIQHKGDHLAMYLITPDTWSKPIIPRLVIIHNQFGTQRLRTGNAVVLAVPSAKVLGTILPTVPPGIPTDLDHFKCYLASGRNIDRRVLLEDQFSKDTPTGVLQPILFCNPVQKRIPPDGTNGSTTLITNPDAHLACYVTTPRRFDSRTLLYKNQFFQGLQGFASLRVSNPDFLCVPSLKLKWFPVPAPSSLVP
jgi:hypothetical protein